MGDKMNYGSQQSKQVITHETRGKLSDPKIPSEKEKEFLAHEVGF